jgi:hypothetical protein
VLAEKGTKLINLGALGHIDAVLVRELLQLRLAPGVNDLVGQIVVDALGLGLGGVECVLRLQVGEARIAANRCNELVTL